MSDAPQYRPDDYADPSAASAVPPPPPQPSSYGQPVAGPQGPAQYGQQPYGAYGQGGPHPQQVPYQGWARPEHPQAQTTFILGIIGIFTGVTAFIAWYLGGQAKKEIEAGAPYAWDGNLKTGYLLGKIFSIIYVVVTAASIVFFVVYMIFIIGLIGALR